MKERIMICAAVLLICTIQAQAQKYEFGKVSKEELLEKIYPLDETANAAILYENKTVSVKYIPYEGYRLVTEVFKRIKFYNNGGFKYGTEEFFLYDKGNSKEKITGLKGATYTLVNDKIKITELKEDGIFRIEYTKFLGEHKFTMPAIQEGSVIEYTYTITSPFLSSVDRIYLQYRIPIKKIEVKFQSPEYYVYKKFSAGYLPIDLKESSSYTYDSVDNTDRTRSIDWVDFNVKTDYISSINIPSFVDEPFLGNSENYISSISYELSYVKFPNRPKRNRATTWEDVTKRIYRSSNFGDELIKTNYYKKDIDQLINGVSDPLKKMSLIFTFLKQKVKWNNVYALGTNEGVKRAYKEGLGNAAEINLILTSMLTYANIDANPVIASTSDRLISLFPTLDGFNYVLTRAKLIDGTIFYLDATDKFGLPNVLPSRVMRGTGRVISKNGTSQRVTFRPQKPSRNQYSIQCELDSAGKIQGKFSVRHMDYLAHSFRVTNAQKDEESNLKRLESLYSISDIQDYEVKGAKEYGKGISEQFSFAVDNQVETIENELFFSPLLFLKDTENVFKSDERKYPVDFGFSFSNMYMVNIKIPDGYEVAEFPKSGVFRLPDNIGKFAYRSNVANGVVQVVVSETINNAVVPADYYLALKEFYNQVIQKENEQVVLKKI